MRINDGAEGRRKRLSDLKQEIVKVANAIKNKRKTNDDEIIQIPLRRFIAAWSINSGLTPKKIREYLKDYEDISFIKVDMERDTMIFYG